MANSRFNKKKKGESEKDSLSVKKSFTIGNEKANDEVKTVKKSFDVTKPTTTQKKTVTVPQQQSQKKYAFFGSSIKALLISLAKLFLLSS